MKRAIFGPFQALILIFLQPFIYCDLPIHCLKHQVAGEWSLKITEPQIQTIPYQMNCGHEIPDNVNTSYLALKDTFKPHTEFAVTLDSDATVKGNSKELGQWTMIYDEGLDISFDNQKFTAFFEYFPDENGQVKNHCGRTVVGWYHNLLSGKKACFKGEKILKSKEEEAGLYGEPLVPVLIVQPVFINFLQISSSSRGLKAARANKAPRLHRDFDDHKLVVDHLNQIPNKLWQANYHSKFEGKTLGELNQLAGRKKFGNSGQRPSLQNSFIQISDISDLPKSFSWEKYLHPMREQGSCGSCYAFATLAMLEARLLIKYNRDIRLSAQHILDCSYYNQGCDGGYPFLVGKFANEFELVPESCSPYIGKKGGCGTCNTKELEEIYKVENYRFIGGAYGKSNERDMMLEVMNNGPIVVSFEPPLDFMYYQGGIFHGVEPEWVTKGENRPEWERVDHSVLLYGWGESEKGEKYWLLLNSWGKEWGENGSFKMVRGIDECSIESLAEAADPIVVNRSQLEKM